MRIWLTLASISLLALACSSSTPTSVDSGTPHSGDPCTDEGAFTCGGIGTICCHGHITTFNDGLCGPVAGDSGVARPDSGIPLCQMYPFRQGCPCTAGDDAGVETCDGAYRMECAGGLWQPSDHACSTYCDLIP
ncbi:MAG: hypothetical protein U0234_24715 [Sandaracinus sp.]